MWVISATRIAGCAIVSALAFGVHAQTSEKIVIDGSTGVAPLVAALAKAYREQGATGEIQIGRGMGTKARLQALREGRIDIAMASHGLNVADVRRQGMEVHEIGKVPVVFGVNSGVPVSGLSGRQICDIYAGTTTNWREVGGPDLAIAALARPESEVDTEVVRDKVGCLRELQFSAQVQEMPKTPDMAKGLAAVAGAIGMTTATVVGQSRGRVRALALGGVAPTADNVQNKTYGLTRDSFLVIKAPSSAAIARFMTFVRSPAGEQVIAENGAVPVK